MDGVEIEISVLLIFHFNEISNYYLAIGCFFVTEETAQNYKTN